ncbi:MAG: hypothetical protein HYZ33_00875 [Ignavibacteriales bacterium]|nr:hypothetical protein [Ignavibacteriales bacterium]
MNIQTRKLNLIEWLLQVQDQTILEKIESLKQKAKVKAYESKLKPMSSVEFLARVQAAEDDIKQNRLMSQEDFCSESDNW